jgi:hypothetical protein
VHPCRAEGFKKDGTVKVRERISKKKTVICNNWTEARAGGRTGARVPPGSMPMMFWFAFDLCCGAAPPGAPSWWGCPRGKFCDYAHGEEELRGDAALVHKARQAEEAKAAASAKTDAVCVHVSLPPFASLLQCMPCDVWFVALPAFEASMRFTTRLWSPSVQPSPLV